MPIEAAHPLDEVLDAVEEHARVTGLAPMWAVTPLAGVNDTDDDARALAALVRAFEARAGVRPRLSVVPYNAIDVGGSRSLSPAGTSRRSSIVSWPTASGRTCATAAAPTSRRRAGSSRAKPDGAIAKRRASRSPTRRAVSCRIRGARQGAIEVT